MNRDNNRDSTTDFFLKFIQDSKENEERKKKEKDSKSKERFKNELPISFSKTKFLDSSFKVVNVINFIIDKMLESKRSVQILSFLLAAFLLFSVNGGTFENIFSTPNSGDYIRSVKVDVHGLRDNYVVTGLPNTVSVGLVGPSVDIYATKLSKDYGVYADFSSASEGEQIVELKAQGFPANLEVLIVPQTCTVTISKKVTKTFKLGYQFINEENMDKQYSVGVESLEHDEVEVRGSQEALDKINHVNALIDVENVEESFTQECNIQAFDRSDDPVDVEIIPKKVKVNCSLSSYSKKVPLVPKYNGRTVNGYAIDNVDFSKDEVMIYGEEAALKSIDKVEVNMDIDGLASGTDFKDLKLILPENVNKMSFTTVDAEVSIAECVSKQVDNIPVQMIGGNESDFDLGNVKLVSVEIWCSKTKASHITSEDFKAYVDVSKLRKNKRELPIEIEISDPTIEYRILSSKTVFVTKKK